MILGLMAFTYTAINFSPEMHGLLLSVQNIHDQVLQLYLPDNYLIWGDILLQPSLIVLVGFSIVARLLAGIVSAAFELGWDVPTLAAAEPLTASNSPFGRWG